MPPIGPFPSLPALVVLSRSGSLGALPGIRIIGAGMRMERKQILLISAQIQCEESHSLHFLCAEITILFNFEAHLQGASASSEMQDEAPFARAACARGAHWTLAVAGGYVSSPGRPRLCEEPTKVVSIRLPVSVIKASEAKAKSLGETRSQRMREAIIADVMAG